MGEHDVYLNDYATRCFRDIADWDYVTARSAFRMGAHVQFLWCGLQAIEKYLKAILLYNRVSWASERIGHDLSRALEVAEKLPFRIELSEPSKKMIAHLDTYGRFRYLDVPYHVERKHLVMLDKAIYEIRSYCRVLNYTLGINDADIIQMMPRHLEAIAQAKESPSRKTRIPGGVLELILDDRTHAARPALVWKNLFFNNHGRRKVAFQWGFHAVNAPLSLRPELLDTLLQFIWLPGEVVRAYREELARRGKGAP